MYRYELHTLLYSLGEQLAGLNLVRERLTGTSPGRSCARMPSGGRSEHVGRGLRAFARPGRRLLLKHLGTAGARQAGELRLRRARTHRCHWAVGKRRRRVRRVSVLDHHETRVAQLCHCCRVAYRKQNLSK